MTNTTSIALPEAHNIIEELEARLEQAIDALIASDYSEGYIQDQARMAHRKPEVSPEKWARTYGRDQQSYDLHLAFHKAFDLYRSTRTWIDCWTAV